ncbi:hypothetical protein POL68_20660 [Stigmatella sp. ncwal1]|uniref:Uncharacterized protein n=1 Tax=Stigmatella ashevillensis TaxID=2995309 RepID=A0ABT5DEZ4_9BACT|nr:hypothetical protein [Stigmatella ashevillena]MDC0710897.1 hypothetical protein [Stigmatella ashevillena]
MRLSFTQAPILKEQRHLSRQEAQATLLAFHTAFLKERPRIRIISPPGRSAGQGTSEWEQRLRAEFLSRFGTGLLPLPNTLGDSRLSQALRLSPGYMGHGVREAAQDLFGSPVFLASVTLSVLVYFAAWLVPEPLFSKAFAATATVALALAVGVMELTHLAWACLRLYRESEAATSQQALEAAAERFGKAVGGAGLRVLVMVASFGVGRVLPTSPPSLGGWMGAPRYAVEGGLALEASTTVQVVSDGALVVSGGVAGEVASHLCGGLALCATIQGASGTKLSTHYGPPHTRQNPRHNEAIEQELASREAAGHTDLRKNRAQVDAQGDAVTAPTSTEGARFRRPDASSLRPDGVRHNTNYVSNPQDLKRELEAFEAMVSADKNALHELYTLDGKLVRRHVPSRLNIP